MEYEEKTDEPVKREETGGTSSRKKGPERPLFRSRGPRALFLFRLQLLDPPFELVHYVGIAQGRDVTQLAALGDVAQEAAHDLARARLGQVIGPDDALGARDLADPHRDVLADLGDEVVTGLVAALQRHERRDRLPGVL